MRIIILIILGCIAFFSFVRYLESVSVFYPTRQIDIFPDHLGLPFEEIFLKTQDGVILNGWFIENPQASSSVIFFHGNAGNIGDRLDKILTFYELGLNVFIIDYRGYGKSQGKPSEEGMYQDATATYDYLVTRKDINPQRIIVYGASLGGVAAIDLATKRDLAALIIDSSFTSAADMCKRIYPFVPTVLMTTKMDSQDKIKKVKIPKFFIHSLDDEVVPFKLGQKLFELAPAPKDFLKVSGAHMEAHIASRGVFIEGVGKFLKDCGLI